MSPSPLAPLAILALFLVVLLAGAGDATGPPAEMKTAAEADRGAERGASALERRLVPVLADVTTSIEPSCPPPAVLACRPAIRLTGELSTEPSPQLQRRVGLAVGAALRRDGFREVRLEVDADGGRARSGLETLARWRTSGDRIEVATGGLELAR